MKKIVIAVALGILVLLVFKSKNVVNHADEGAHSTTRIETTLPNAAPDMVESSSFMVYSTGLADVPTAIGQIFSADPKTPALIKVGFFLCPCDPQSQPSSFNLQARLSEWTGERPAEVAIWQSPAKSLKLVDYKWIYFDVPHKQLDPKKKYIVWLTLSGLGNPSGTSFGIPSMGSYTTTGHPAPTIKHERGATPTPSGEWKPSSWTSFYPEGRRAFFKHFNPDGVTDDMTRLPWQTDNLGQNVHFQMVFENHP
jgi:hypothetical protein